jgi:RNA recognition motif-containing protein
MDIYVGNLPFNSTEEEISDLFSQFGGVERVKLVTDRETGRPRGFGFVTLADQSRINEAVEALNGQDFQGRGLRVNASEPREQRRPGGGGGGGGGGYGGGGGGGRGGDRDRRGGGGGGGGGGGRRRNDYCA